MFSIFVCQPRLSTVPTTTIDKTAQFLELLNEFQEIQVKNIDRLPTYLEIAGKAHKEDTISNILAFFFSSEQPHGLGSLFVDSFLTCMGIEAGELIGQVEAYREVYTAKGKRIDLVIETEGTVLVIENKINHWLHNDLDEYAAHAYRHYKNKKIFLAVLSIDAQQCRHSFINVTYERFLEEVNKRILYIKLDASNRYYLMLQDFFQTLKNLRFKTMINEEIRAFFIEHKDVITQFKKESDNLDREVSNRAYQLLQKVTTRADVQKLVWNKCVLVNQKTFPNGLYLKADCIVNIEGYHFHTFIQRDGRDDSTSTLLNNIPYFKDNSGWNVWLPPIAFDVPLEVVAQKMDEFIQAVFQ